MLLEVAKLTEISEAEFASVGFLTGVFLEVVFDIARFCKYFVAIIEQTLVMNIQVLSLRVRHLEDTVPGRRDILKTTVMLFLAVLKATRIRLEG